MRQFEYKKFLGRAGWESRDWKPVVQYNCTLMNVQLYINEWGRNLPQVLLDLYTVEAEAEHTSF